MNTSNLTNNHTSPNNNEFLEDEDVVMVDCWELPSTPTPSMTVEKNRFFYGPQKTSIHPTTSQDECSYKKVPAHDLPALGGNTEGCCGPHKTKFQWSLYNDTCPGSSADLAKSHGNIVLEFTLQASAVALRFEIRKP